MACKKTPKHKISLFVLSFSLHFVLCLCYTFLCRLGSTLPFLWIMQLVLPLQYRTVRISWACCLVYSFAHKRGFIQAIHWCHFLKILISTDCLWAMWSGLKQGRLTLTRMPVRCLKDNVKNSRTKFVFHGTATSLRILDALCFINNLKIKH